MKLAVITATIGEKRRAMFTPNQINPAVNYVCFADRAVTVRGAWKVQRVERDHSITSVMQAKRYKIMAHEMVPDADAIMWCDSHCRLMCDPLKVFDEFSECLGLVLHPRGCVYRELRACRKQKKDAPYRLERTAEILQNRLHHPARAGVYYGGFIARRITPESNRLMKAWWQMIGQTTQRDQISLPVVLARDHVPFHVFGRGRRPEMFQIKGK